MRTLWLGLMVLTISADAQKFGAGIGVKGGFPFTDLIAANGSAVAFSTSDNYLVGPVAELRIPLGFAFEVDGLYRGTEYNVANAGNLPAVFRSASWEIPYMGKFRFPIPLLKPFITAGGAYRTFTDLPSGVNASHNAFVAGLGLELRIKRLRLSAEGRYLHWNPTSSNVGVRLTSNQGEVLFGMMF